MTIIERIQNLLKSQGLSASELCRSTGIQQATYSAWKMKNRNPGAEYITPIAKFFGVSERYLLTGEEDAPVLLEHVDRPKTSGEELLLEYWRRLNEYGHIQTMIAVNDIMRDPKSVSKNDDDFDL